MLNPAERLRCLAGVTLMLWVNFEDDNEVCGLFSMPPMLLLQNLRDGKRFLFLMFFSLAFIQLTMQMGMESFHRLYIFQKELEEVQNTSQASDNQQKLPTKKLNKAQEQVHKLQQAEADAKHWKHMYTQVATEQHEVKRELEEAKSTLQASDNHQKSLTEKLNEAQEQVSVFEKKLTEYKNACQKGLSVYMINQAPKVKVLIVNNIIFENCHEDYRGGAEVDQLAIESLFGDLHFEVNAHINLRKLQMLELFEKTAKDLDSSYDMFFAIIMSHGGEGDVVSGTDNRVVSVSEIVREFLPESCPSLSGKPKCFIVQSCRGKERQQAATGDSRMDSPGSTSHLANTTFPQEADFLIAFSTTPGHVAYLSNEGSTFIQTIYEVFRDHYDTKHLVDMFTEVKKKVSEESAPHEKQMPVVVDTLRGEVFLTCQSEE